MKKMAMVICGLLIMSSGLVGCVAQPTRLGLIEEMEVRRLIRNRSMSENTPSQYQIDHADYGQMPNNFQEIIRQYYKNKLFDPYSAVYEFATPIKGWQVLVDERSVDDQIRIANEVMYQKSKNSAYDPGAPLPAARADILFGWVCKGTINAKNRMGAYVGSEPFEFILVKGIPIKIEPMPGPPPPFPGRR